MAKNIPFQGLFDFFGRFRKEFLIKGLLVILLTVVALLLIFTNRDLVKQNTKMIKFIKNRDVFEQNLVGLRQSDAKFEKAVLRIQGSADLEKLKADHIDQLLKIVKVSDIKVDSYRSAIEKKDGFVIFKYDLTIVGDFINVLRFFSRLGKDAPHAYVAGYDIRLHQEKLTRMGLTVEVLGIEG